ncbi:MAG: hypothetical protein ACE5L7_08115 [Candidatus Aminicenantales bacterium]
MDFFLFKSIVALLFLLAGVLAVLSMFILMGKPDPKTSASSLRRLHRTSGFVFFILMIVISYFCIKYWIMAGDTL